MSNKGSKRTLKYCAVVLAVGMLCAGAAQAGPRIDFGDDGGFVQIDLKGQFYVENTSYGGGMKGDESRTDLHFMRNRFGLTGMIDETWGYKFQTCGNTGTTKMPVMYSLSAQDNDWNDRDIRIIDAYPTSFGVPTVTAQYLKVDFDDAYKTSFSSAERLGVVSGMNGQKEGYYVKAAHILPFKIAKAGKLQPYGLYEDWKFAHLLGIDDQKVQQYGAGINYYVLGDQRVRVTAEYLKTNFDKLATLPVAGTAGYATKNFDTFRMMLQVVF